MFAQIKSPKRVKTTIERAARRNPAPFRAGSSELSGRCEKELFAPFRSGESPSLQEGVLQIPPRRHKGNITFGRREKTDIEKIVEICVSQVERGRSDAERDCFPRKLSLLTAEVERLERELFEKDKAIKAIEREFSKVDALAQKAFWELYTDMTWAEVDLESRLSVLQKELEEFEILF